MNETLFQIRELLTVSCYTELLVTASLFKLALCSLLISAVWVGMEEGRRLASLMTLGRALKDSLVDLGHVCRI